MGEKRIQVQVQVQAQVQTFLWVFVEDNLGKNSKIQIIGLVSTLPKTKTNLGFRF